MLVEEKKKFFNTYLGDLRRRGEAFWVATTAAVVPAAAVAAAAAAAAAAAVSMLSWWRGRLSSSRVVNREHVAQL